MSKTVLVVGTGTIGLPLIGLLARHKQKFGIDSVLFNKNTPLKHDSAQIKQMVKLGANLVTDKEKFEDFKDLGLNPLCSKEEAIEQSTVIVDCTPKGVGLRNKKEFYNKYKDKVKGFVAQGSEFGFGKPFARGISELTKDDQFVQVVSCNTHNIVAIVKSLENNISSVIPGGIFSGDFICMRRSSDISQDTGFVPSVFVGKHDDPEFGTHHAKDAFRILKDEFPHIKLFSSAVKLNTQYMHAIRFSICVDHIGEKNTEWAIERFRKNPFIAITSKVSSNSVFSFGREFGLYGRILSQTVVVEPTVMVRKIEPTRYMVTGFAYTPQDSNSLLSSIYATLFFLDPETAEEKIKAYDPYIFQEI